MSENQYYTEEDKNGRYQFYKDLANEKFDLNFNSKTLDFYQYSSLNISPISALETFDDLKRRDEQREKDGFKKKLKVGQFTKPGDKGKVIIIPSVEEEKLVHGPIDPDLPGSGTGQGDGDEGDPVDEEGVCEGEEEGEGDESGAGKGSSGEHEIDQDAYEFGKELTEKFQLPNLKDTGKKAVIPYYEYDLANKTKRSGQILDKKETLKNILSTNLSLVDKPNPKIDDLDLSNLIIVPKDKVFRTLDREKHYQSQAVVFFIRDYSGSMYGKPTEAVVSQHVMIYSWLMYQYGNRVIPRFIVHDTEAKEVADFNIYYKSKIQGGTRIHTAYELVESIIEDENLKNYNLYIFQGSDGDDWESKEKKATPILEKLMNYCNRTGILIAKNEFTRGDRVTDFEKELMESNLLDNKEKLRLDTIPSDEITEERLIESIKSLVSED